MFKSKMVATVNEFQGSTANPAKADKNGLMPVIFDVLAGSCPSKIVLSGTIAERSGFEVGKIYAIQVRERTADEYGRQFSYNKIGEVSALDALNVESILGAPIIVDVSKDSTGVNESVEKTEKAEEYTKH